MLMILIFPLVLKRLIKVKTMKKYEVWTECWTLGLFENEIEQFSIKKIHVFKKYIIYVK